MLPYCYAAGLLTVNEERLLDAVRNHVNALPNGLTCHEVAERIAREFSDRLVWVRGTFNGWDHSWCEVLGVDHRVVIDPYPWACGSGPIMVDCRTGSPWSTLYWS